MTYTIFLMYFSRALMLLLVLPLREVAKGLVAKWRGDDTAERQGRITLNPFAHLDPMGSLLIFLTGFGWGKPLPMNPSRMRNPRASIALISLAGPMANLITALVCALIHCLMRCSEAVIIDINSGEVTPIICIMYILECLVSIGVGLAVFHLLPLPQMDGFNILRYVAGNKFERWYYANYRQFNTISMIVLLVLFVLPSDINPLIYIMSAVENLLWKSVNWIVVLRWS